VRRPNPDEPSLGRRSAPHGADFGFREPLTPHLARPGTRQGSSARASRDGVRSGAPLRGMESELSAAEIALVGDAAEPRDAGLLTELVSVQQVVLASDLDLDAVMAEIAVQAQRLTRADAAVIEMLEGEELVYRAAAGAAVKFEGLRMSAATSLSGRAIRTGDILWCQDAGSDPRVDLQVAREAGARSLVIVPLVQRRKAEGALKLYASRAHAFGERELRVVQMLAGLLGFALSRAELLQRLARVATTDRLTGLPNRRAWDERAPRELARAARSGNPVCLALLDLDHFRAFNEAHGREAGDALLKSCAARWWDHVRSVDLLARLGGEEFALLLPNCIAPDAVVAVERLRAASRDLRHVSIGIAQWDMQEPIESLMLRADVALYRAKKSGRDRVVLADGHEGHPPERRPAPLDID
jgi:diguanylate cyclase (GGDEF)-like protein